MQLEDRAALAAGYIGRCTTLGANEFFERRARRWKYWAGVVHECLKREVGITDEHQNQTRNDVVDANKWNQAERRYAISGSAAIVGDDWDIDTEAF